MIESITSLICLFVCSITSYFTCLFPPTSNTSSSTLLLNTTFLVIIRIFKSSWSSSIFRLFSCSRRINLSYRRFISFSILLFSSCIFCVFSIIWVKHSYQSLGVTSLYESSFFKSIFFTINRRMGVIIIQMNQFWLLTLMRINFLPFSFFFFVCF